MIGNMHLRKIHSDIFDTYVLNINDPPPLEYATNIPLTKLVRFLFTTRKIIVPNEMGVYVGSLFRVGGGTRQTGRVHTSGKSAQAYHPPRFRPNPERGNIVGSRYILAHPRGEGRSARVWLGKDWFTGDDLAIKIAALPSEVRDFDQLLQAEAGLLRKLAGVPGVVRHLGDSETDAENDGYFYIAMEWVRGRSLGEILVQQGPFSRTQVTRWGSQIAETLHRIHTLGILHGDISTSNVLVEGATQNVKLIDFGIGAAYQSGQVKPGGRFVNQDYMAPELVRREPISTATDIYALGVTLFRVSTGILPFTGKTEEEMDRAHLTRPIPSHPRLEDPLRRIIWRCMAKAPELRYSTAAEVAADLASV